MNKVLKGNRYQHSYENRIISKKHSRIGVRRCKALNAIGDLKSQKYETELYSQFEYGFN